VYKSPNKTSITAANAFFKSFGPCPKNILEGGGMLMAARKNGVRYIFTAYVTRPDGTRDYAKNHGLRAFCIPVKDKRK
jgi:hypothetical protein